MYWPHEDMVNNWSAFNDHSHAAFDRLVEEHSREDMEAFRYEPTCAKRTPA